MDSTHSCSRWIDSSFYLNHPVKYWAVARPITGIPAVSYVICPKSLFWHHKPQADNYCIRQGFATFFTWNLITMKILQPVTKVLLTLFIVLLVAETLLRLVESHLSGNVAHIQEIPELSAQYDQYSEPGILFLGNSLSNNAIDAPLFRSEMDEQGVVFSVIEKIVPDATTIWSWSCILRNRIFELDNKPNTVFIGFAWNQLSDQSRLLPTRLGGFFCTNTDLMHLAQQARVSSAEIGEFLTASTFRMFTHREIIRNRVAGGL